MNKNYVIINLETNGCFNIDDDKKIIFIEAIKVDKELNKIDEFKRYIKSKDEIIEFIKFCEDSKVIVCNDNNELSFILKELYKNKIISNFKFKYIDIRDIFKSKKDIVGKLNLDTIKKYYNVTEEDNINSILDIISIYLKENNIANLDDLFLSQPFHGKTFRGLNYPKYLCDVMIGNNKYYGYIVDFSNDRYVSYYAFLKELNNEYFNIDEIKMLKEYGAKVIMNVSYLCEESLSFVDYYSVQAVNDNNKVTSDCYKLINGIDKFIEYYKCGIKLKLILWGSIDKLEKQYEVIERDKLEYFISLIDLVKGPWDYFTNDDLKILDLNG